MFSNFLKTFIILIIIIYLMWGFSDSYSASNIDNIAHITAIAIDKNDNPSADLKVSFQFVDVSGSGGGSGGGSESSSSSNVIIIGVTSNTIDNAISKLNAYIGKQVNLSHCRNLIFSRDFASEGIATEIFTLINNVQMRPFTNIVISTSEASDYLKNSNPNVEELISKYYDTFELTSNFTGYSDDATLGKFYDNILRSEAANTAILGETFAEVSSKSESGSSSQSSSGSNSQSIGSETSQSGEQGSSSQSGGNAQSSSGGSSQSGEQGSSSQSGSNSQNVDSSESVNDDSPPILDESAQRGTRNVGIAVFNNDTYIGELSSEESMYHLLVTNNVDSFEISVPIENYDKNILNFRISPYKASKISVDTSSETPKIHLEVFCEAHVLSIESKKDYGNIDFINNTCPIIENYIKENISSYLNKTSKEFQVDIANFYAVARSNFLTIPEWNNYNWNEKYKNVNFSIDVNVNLNSQLLYIENQ